jgi:hypothetical protein
MNKSVGQDPTSGEQIQQIQQSKAHTFLLFKIRSIGIYTVFARYQGVWNETCPQYFLSQNLSQNPTNYSLGDVQRFCYHSWCDSIPNCSLTKASGIASKVFQIISENNYLVISLCESKDFTWKPIGQFWLKFEEQFGRLYREPKRIENKSSISYLIFIDPCIVVWLRINNQQDATL